MKFAIRGDDLQRAAGVLTWAVVSGFAVWLVARNPARYPDAMPVSAVLALVNLGAMLIAMGAGGFARRVKLTALWIQLASALAIGWLLPVSFLPIFTIIWIGMASAYFSFGRSVWLLGAIMLAWFAIHTWAWQEDSALISVALWGTFHPFAMLTSHNATAAEAARDEVQALNRELLATQHLLAEASRQGERSRIARDLHDLLGHHLTALSINLQIAERMASGEARDKVEESRALARLLLADVREAVSTLRDERALDVASAIRMVVADVPDLDVELDIEDGLVIDDVDVAEALLRCVQETVTNTLRHSGARRSWIRIFEDEGRVMLEVRDDGEVRGDFAEGNGITGMRERLAKLGGRLRLARAGKALRVDVEIPLAGAHA